MISEGLPGQRVARGVEYLLAGGESRIAIADGEVILSAGTIGSAHLLLHSGIGPRQELEALGVVCLVDSPHVGKHLKDHNQVPLFFPAPGVGMSMGADALRHPAGPLSADLQALKAEAERRLAEWSWRSSQSRPADRVHSLRLQLRVVALLPENRRGAVFRRHCETFGPRCGKHDRAGESGAAT